jgi:hypothetical protein
MALSLRPVSLRTANEFVANLHRHHSRVVGWKFGVGVEDEHHTLHGVIIVGHPLSISLDDDWTLEVTRCCTDGTKNAPSLLYSTAWRITRNLGYSRLITYTLTIESGTSLRAAGWRIAAENLPPKRWDNRRNRSAPKVQIEKIRWEAPHSFKMTRERLDRDRSKVLGQPSFFEKGSSSESFRRDESPTLFNSL